MPDSLVVEVISCDEKKSKSLLPRLVGGLGPVEGRKSGIVRTGVGRSSRLVSPEISVSGALDGRILWKDFRIFAFPINDLDIKIPADLHEKI